MPADPQLHSCLYEGVVNHRRFTPFVHAFRYRIFCVYLDLNELDRLFRGRWLWSTSRPAIARFRREDHFGDPSQPLSDSVRDLVEERISRRPTGPIRLLTHLRYYGYVINPISMYYCFDAVEETVDACVAEVTNTPWGDRHCYVLPSPTVDCTSDRRLSTEKELHVSPFLPMEMQYRWQVTTPDTTLSLNIENHADDRHMFSAGMTLTRRSITTWQLARVLVRYPCMTAKVTAGIHWQAARLWWKGATFHPHPKHRESATPLIPND